jgi:hypothetical protein
MGKSAKVTTLLRWLGCHAQEPEDAVDLTQEGDGEDPVPEEEEDAIEEADDDDVMALVGPARS